MSKIGSSLSIDNVENFEGLIKNFKVDSFSKNSVLFNDNDLLRMNSKNLKELSFEELKQNFKNYCDEKFWKIIRGNIEQFDEIQEWYNIVSEGINTKVAVDKKLLDLIKINIPEKIDLDTWQIWTKKVLEKAEIKPKDLFITIRMLLTGKKFGPSMNELLTLFTKKEILKELKPIVKNKTIKIYDSTLRDGAQTKGVNFSIDDKLRILDILMDIGVDYIEAGWPGANPIDDELFKNLPKNLNQKL